MNLKEVIADLLTRHPDPREKTDGLVQFARQQEREARYPALGIVVDNKDPLCMGKVKVASTMMGPGVVTPWIDIVHRWASNKSGWWQIPDIGVQVLLLLQLKQTREQ